MDKLFKYAMIAASFAVHAESAPRLGNLSGWVYNSAGGSRLIEEFSGGAKGLLSLEKSNDETSPTVLVYELPVPQTKDLDSSVEPWRQMVFKGQLNANKTSLKDRVQMKDGQVRYFAEVSSDIGRANMMPSAIFGKVTDGKVYILVYENRREAYLRNIDEVLKLFHKL